MIWFIVGFVLGNYISSGKKNFIYIGPDEVKYKRAFIGVLTHSSK